nr:lysyl oxidase family protein [bacterium]
PNAPDLSGIKIKSTYCLRDVSTVKISIPNKPEDAGYKICGQRVQGVSVGWGDTYYYTYSDQGMNISDLTSGTYRLKFIVNPSKFLSEVDTENNTSSILFNWNAKKKIIKVLEESPISSPEVNHVYLDDPQ